MERHYKAGFYLIKRQPVKFGADKGKLVSTCSGCINFRVFDHWCLSWMRDKLNEEDKNALGLTDQEIEKIQQWTDSKFGYGANVFPDLKTALEFKELFFKRKSHIEIYSVDFPELDAELLIKDFAEGNNTEEFNYCNGDFELRKNLIRKIEAKNNTGETFVGYDFIGVESGGSFHSFYCHDITKTLIEKFSLRLNDFGLIDQLTEPNIIREYLNGPAARVEPVPWYIVKVKQVRNANN